jgi:hypothetical protein
MKYKVGDLIKIRFYDHAIGTKEVLICETVGWLLEDNKLNVLLTNWIVDTKDEEFRDHNVEHVNILKSCIISTRKLK